MVQTNKNWRRYLSYRVLNLYIVGFSAFALVVLGGILSLTGGRPLIWPVVIGGAALIAIAVTAWFWVIRPYKHTERILSQYLEYYTFHDGYDESRCAMSPAEELMSDQLRELLNPTQLFNLNKRQAQYLALQNQINPHFLYNTLESIRSEALLAELDVVADMTEALATFFRYTITKVENLVSVEEELANCETYFSIQQYRFGDRLRLEIQCDPGDREEIYRCACPS